jgi:hypothetical protein
MLYDCPPPYRRLEVEPNGTQNTRPSGNRTPPANAELAGYVPVGVVSSSATGS